MAHHFADDDQLMGGCRQSERMALPTLLEWIKALYEHLQKLLMRITEEKCVSSLVS